MLTEHFSKQQFDKMTNSVKVFRQLIKFSIFFNRNINLIAGIN